MTNIMAVKVQEKTGDTTPPKEYIICCADGQATYMDGSKSGGTQKLARIGSSFIMGTGVLQYLVHAVRGLNDRANHLDTPEDIADKVMKICEPMQPKSKTENCLNLIIAGYNKGRAQILEVCAIPTEPGKTYIQEKDQFAFDGSGRKFVVPSAQLGFQIGTRVLPQDLTEGMLLTFDFATTADQDLGVNEQFQLGIIGPGQRGLNIRELFHPVIHLNARPSYHAEYIHQLLGIKRPFPFPEKPSDEEIENGSAIYATLDEFYRVLTTELGRLQQRDIRTNYMHAQMRTGNPGFTLEEYTKSVADRKAQKAIVEPIINALYEGDLRAILDQNIAFQERVRGHQQRVFGLYRSQIAPLGSDEGTTKTTEGTQTPPAPVDHSRVPDDKL